MHLGHRANKCHPKMKPFIYSKSNNYHLLDLIKSYYYTRNALRYLQNSASEGKTILFVGTKKEAKRVIAESALECNSFYINEKWVGGLLTNWKTFKKSTRNLLRLERQQRNGFLAKLPKKEMAKKLKEKEKLTRLFDGIKYMRYLPDIVVIVGQSEELNAINECKKLKIRTITLLDTDCNPTLADFLIPANDDSPSSIQLVLSSFAQAIQEGQDFYDRHKPPEPKKQKFGQKRGFKGYRGQKWRQGQKQGQKPGQNWRKNQNPGQRFGQKPGQRFSQKQGQRFGQKSDQQFGQKPGQRFGQKPGQRFGQKPGQRFGQKPGQRLGQRPDPRFSQKPGQKFGQKPGQKFGQKFGQKPGQKSVQRFGQKPSQRFGQKSGQRVEQRVGQKFEPKFSQTKQQKPKQTLLYFQPVAERLGLNPGQSPWKRRFQGFGETKPLKYVQRNKSSIKWKKQQKALPKAPIKKTLPPKQTVQIPDLLERPKWTPPKEESATV